MFGGGRSEEGMDAACAIRHILEEFPPEDSLSSQPSLNYRSSTSALADAQFLSKIDSHAKQTMFQDLTKAISIATFADRHLHDLVTGFTRAFKALGIEVPVPEIQKMSELVLLSMSHPKRVYHSFSHLFDVTPLSAADENPLEFLATMFHDIVYFQLDECIPPHLLPILHRAGLLSLPSQGALKSSNNSISSSSSCSDNQIPPKASIIRDDAELHAASLEENTCQGCGNTNAIVDPAASLDNFNVTKTNFHHPIVHNFPCDVPQPPDNPQKLLDDEKKYHNEYNGNDAHMPDYSDAIEKTPSEQNDSELSHHTLYFSNIIITRATPLIPHTPESQILDDYPPDHRQQFASQRAGLCCLEPDLADYHDNLAAFLLHRIETSPQLNSDVCNSHMEKLGALMNPQSIGLFTGVSRQHLQRCLGNQSPSRDYLLPREKIIALLDHGNQSKTQTNRSSSCSSQESTGTERRSRSSSRGSSSINDISPISVQSARVALEIISWWDNQEDANASTHSTVQTDVAPTKSHIHYQLDSVGKSCQLKKDTLWPRMSEFSYTESGCTKDTFKKDEKSSKKDKDYDAHNHVPKNNYAANDDEHSPHLMKEQILSVNKGECMLQNNKDAVSSKLNMTKNEKETQLNIPSSHTDAMCINNAIRQSRLDANGSTGILRARQHLAHRICYRVFGFGVGDVILCNPSPTGFNEFLSAVIAVEMLYPWLSPLDILHICVCIELTIPFRSPSTVDALYARCLQVFTHLRHLDMVTEEDVHRLRQMMEDACNMAARDVSNFAAIDTRKFLSNTWKLLPEIHPPLQYPSTITFGDWMNALASNIKFFEFICNEPIRVFPRFGSCRTNEQQRKMLTQTSINLQRARFYVGSRLIYAAIVHALFSASGHSVIQPVADIFRLPLGGDFDVPSAVRRVSTSSLVDMAVECEQDQPLQSQINYVLDDGYATFNSKYLEVLPAVAPMQCSQSLPVNQANYTSTTLKSKSESHLAKNFIQQLLPPQTVTQPKCVHEQNKYDKSPLRNEIQLQADDTRGCNQIFSPNVSDTHLEFNKHVDAHQQVFTFDELSHEDESSSRTLTQDTPFPHDINEHLQCDFDFSEDDGDMEAYVSHLLHKGFTAHGIVFDKPACHASLLVFQHLQRTRRFERCLKTALQYEEGTTSRQSFLGSIPYVLLRLVGGQLASKLKKSEYTTMRIAVSMASPSSAASSSRRSSRSPSLVSRAESASCQSSPGLPSLHTKRAGRVPSARGASAYAVLTRSHKESNVDVGRNYYAALNRKGQRIHNQVSPPGRHSISMANSDSASFS
eukprot:gene985-4228_t